MQSDKLEDAWFYVTDIFLRAIRPNQVLVSTKIDMGKPEDLSITIVCEDDKQESQTIVISREYFNLYVKKICSFLIESQRTK